MLPRKTTQTILTFAGLVLLLILAKVARPLAPASLVDFRPRTSNVPPLEAVRPAPVRPVPPQPAAGAPDLIDERENLKVFYQALWRTESKIPGAVTRVLHYGDSPVTADSITADTRALLQEHYGDAGHGFVLIAKPWAWYGHRGVDVLGKGWRIEAATQSRARDGLHGLGGVSFQGAEGAVSQFVLKEEHARMEVQFLRQPDGGMLAVRAEGQPLGEIDTRADVRAPGFHTFALPGGTRAIDLSVERGTVRLFGVTFERDEPGVIYNSLGLNGGQVQSVVRYFDQGLWSAELQHQRPDLVVLNYGTNESIYADYIEHAYAGELREVIRRVKSAVPHASILVMSPMDRGQRDGTGQITTVPALPRLVDIQRQTAAEMGCAFFNTFQAMGGAGTMARWYESQPRLVSADFTHPLPAGARKVGVLLDQALEAGYRRFQAKYPTQLAQQVGAGGQ
ncbi:MAG TPA: GDSL-type esterase/lipase family protein [Bryobacteraceae bacterium]|nr:GDSL-type esterase/lipase family protein [Bryobacteraceae bacterium]